MGKRIRWLDGLKGIACVMIFYHHFLLEYYPESYHGSGSGSLMDKLSQMPFAFPVNGNFFVFLFIMISGYVMTKKIMSLDHDSYGIYQVKRWFNLMIPILVNDTLMWLLYKAGHYYTFEDMGMNPPYWRVIQSAVIRTLWFGDMSFVGAFWMMNYIFVGGVLVSIVTTIGWKKGKENHALFIAILCCWAFYTQQHYYYSVIFAGCIFAMLEPQMKIDRKNIYVKCISSAMLIVGLFFAAYPTGRTPTNIYRFFILEADPSNSFYPWHWVAAVLVIVSINNLPKVQKLFENRFMLWLGSISYIFYVFHMTFTLGTKKIFQVVEANAGKSVAALLNSTIIVAGLLIWSSLYVKFVNPYVKVLMDKLKLNN